MFDTKRDEANDISSYQVLNRFSFFPLNLDLGIHLGR